MVKAADKLSALIKCVEERRMGNTEFVQAEAAMRESLRQMALPELSLIHISKTPLRRLYINSSSPQSMSGKKTIAS